MENRLQDELYDEDDEDTQKDKFLTFHIENEDYGVEIRYVTEIIGMQKITEVPDMPKFVKGVINLRGKVIPVMDVRLRFGMDFQEYNDRTCIIVADIGETTVGLIVDKVQEVINIAESQIELPPNLNDTEGNQFIKGMGKVDDEVKILLDVETVLYHRELGKVTASS